MADKKIIQLDETQSLENFYVPGSKDNSGNLSSMKFNLGDFKEEVDNTSNYIKSGLEEFSTEKKYYTGEYVVYDNNIYRFISYHPAGEWSLEDTTQISILSELTEIYTYPNSYETLNINIASNDNAEGFSEGIQVTLILSNNITLQETSDSSGTCIFKIPIGLEYTIKMPDRIGYDSIGDATFTSEFKSRNLNILYQKINTQKELCDIEIHFTTTNGEPFIQSSFNGKNCYLTRNYEVWSATTIVSGVATFTGLEKGVSYTILLPENIAYYTKSSNIKSIIPSDSQNIVNVVYKYNYNNSSVETPYKNYGLLLVYEENGSYKEVLLEELFTNRDTERGAWIGSSYGITKDNLVAIHVYTETLANKGYDFYIKVDTLLRKSGSYANKQWSNHGVLYPNVNGDDGKLNTYYMCYDSIITLNSTSPDLKSDAADWVTKQTFQYKKNNEIVTLHGFIGSKNQMQEVMYRSTRPRLGAALWYLGLISNPNTYNNGPQVMTSSQNGAPYILYYNYLVNSNNGYSNASKVSSLSLYPIFSF